MQRRAALAHFLAACPAPLCARRMVYSVFGRAPWAIPLRKALLLAGALLLIFTLSSESQAQQKTDLTATHQAVSASAAKNMIPDAAPCPSGPLPAQPLRLQEVIERALCHHPKSKLAWAEVKAQAAQLSASKAAYLPTLSGALGANRNETTYRGEAGPDPMAAQRTKSRFASLNFSWVLFDFGQRSANLEQARQLLIAANATQDERLQEVFIDAVQAYDTALAKQASVAAAQAAKKAAHDSLIAAQARYQAGVTARADQLQAQTADASAAIDAAKAKGEFKNALGALAIILGAGPQTPLTLADDPPRPDARFAATVEALIQQAKEAHPSLVAAQAKLKAARAQVDAARAQGRPSIQLTGRLSQYQGSGQHAFTDTASRRESMIGIELQIPISELWANRSRIKQAQAQAQARQADLEEAEQHIALSVWQNYQALMTETTAFQNSQRFVSSAAQSLKIARGRYRAGVGAMTELLNAQAAAAQAQHQRAQILADWRAARLKLAASLGALGFWSLDADAVTPLEPVATTLPKHTDSAGAVSPTRLPVR